MAGKAKKRTRTGGGTTSRQATGQASSASRQAAREEKRAQFETPRRRTGLHLLLGGAVLALVVGVAAVVLLTHGGGGTATATTASADDGAVMLPVAQVNDGKAHFYTYDANGTTVKYFVLASADGTVRAALDACEVCYPQQKGYHQEVDAMVCNNCGKVFASDQINVITGGCNPIPLTRKVSGSNLVIAASSLAAGAQYFE